MNTLAGLIGVIIYALQILIYIIIVGPLDYLVLKKLMKRLTGHERMEWTWITFPTVVLVVSIGAYYQNIEEAQSPIKLARIERWHLLPGYLDALADRVRDALQKFSQEVRAEVPIIFSAHSLPERILSWHDPYPDELRATVAGVIQRLGPQPHEFAYQSAAISNEPWLGPDVGAALDRLAREGRKHALIAPIGFVVEHVEILYDIDVVYQQQAEKLGLQLERIEMLNAAPPMIAGLAGLVRSTAKEAGWL